MSAAYFAAPVTFSSAFSRLAHRRKFSGAAQDRLAVHQLRNASAIQAKSNRRIISLVGAALAAESRVNLVLSFQPIVKFAARSKATVRGN
jgi:hypothetical protein